MRKPLLSLKDQVRKRAGNCCEKCGVKIVRRKSGNHNGSIHHRLPRRLGGKDTLSNLVLVCLPCHRDIHRQEWRAARAGWIAWCDPDMTPVHLHTDGWALLVPDGTYEYVCHQVGERLIRFVNGCSQAA